MHILAAILADLNVLVLVLPYELAGMAVLVVVLTMAGAPTIKFLVPAISWRQALFVCASATAIGFGIYFIIVDVIAFVGMEAFGEELRHEVIGKLSAIGLLVSPCLMSRKIERLGHHQSFPGIGIKVFIGWTIWAWIVAGAIFLAVKLFTT